MTWLLIFFFKWHFEKKCHSLKTAHDAHSGSLICVCVSVCRCVFTADVPGKYFGSWGGKGLLSLLKKQMVGVEETTTLCLLLCMFFLIHWVGNGNTVPWTGCIWVQREPQIEKIREDTGKFMWLWTVGHIVSFHQALCSLLVYLPPQPYILRCH